MLGSFLGPATFPVAILMQVTLCLQGFATGVIYGGLFTKLRRLVCERGRHTVVYKNLSSPSFPTFDTGTGYGLSHNSRHPVSIFVSTFNMGEARLTTSDLVRPNTFVACLLCCEAIWKPNASSSVDRKSGFLWATTFT